ncbi:M91 family zinc metallopeptidase [Pseudomonas marginalis]|uniref:M91 family zinc metallopeptidase n=1 Tax=Pseudomonas TaxID=286 RepID=UPI00389A9864
MLSATTSPTFPTAQSALPATRNMPEASPYDPPADLTPGIYNERSHTLHIDGDIKFGRLIVWDASDPKNPKIKLNLLMLETGDGADCVHVRNWPGNRLQVCINGKSYVFDNQIKQDPQQGLWIETKGGNDTVIIDDDVKLRVDIEGGDGHDYIQAGGGRSRLYGGNGNDVLRLGSGLGFAAGNDGDDTIIGGSGNAVMYGNNGKDRLYAGYGPSTKQSYLDGGDGNDQLYAGSGHTVAHGGNGNDDLIGHDRTTFYTGKGCDRIWNNRRKDLIYANAHDRFDRSKGSTFTEVKPSNAGKQAFTVAEGTLGFNQQVSDDLEFLRSSPLGQQALAKMDELAAINGATVEIRQVTLGDTSYDFGSVEPDNQTSEEEENIDETQYGTLKNGVPGARARNASIAYDPYAVLESTDHTNVVAPVTTLFHENGHAFNGANGTFLEGEDQEQLQSGAWVPVRNYERQVIGIPSNATPADLDNDPSTPPSTVNPRPFMENALNQEMGKPLRKTHKFEHSDQGDGI